MAKLYSGDNPSQLYLQALDELVREGDIVSPRGKAVKELRPVTIEFLNPINRVTFVKGRKVNPFFQMAESLWILKGRADVDWLTKYNRNMAQFSDDGEFFNAPYGERLRFWNLNTYKDFVFNPIDQLVDVYEKLKKDLYTRQAVAVIYNPMFDNHSYGGKDTPCNLILTFKVRKEKLDLTVFNRSNDLHWGTFGANLCQFATIQEVVASWLGLKVGKYCQITDSLHIYLDDYGAKETDKILKAYNLQPELGFSLPVVKHFTFENEPRITSNYEQFEGILNGYFDELDDIVHNDEVYEDFGKAEALLEGLRSCPDPYLRNSFIAMFTYRAHRLEKKGLVLTGLDNMEDSQWKLSCLYFLYNSYKDDQGFRDLYSNYTDDMKSYIEGV